MTDFELILNELNIPITLDKSGMYTGLCKACYLKANEIILSDDPEINILTYSEKIEYIKNVCSLFKHVKVIDK